MTVTDWNPDPDEPKPPTSAIFVWFMIVGAICLAAYAIGRACGALR